MILLVCLCPFVLTLYLLHPIVVWQFFILPGGYYLRTSSHHHGKSSTVLSSPIYQISNVSCLRFYYFTHKSGSGLKKATLALSVRESPRNMSTIWRVRAVMDNAWYLAQVGTARQVSTVSISSLHIVICCTGGAASGTVPAAVWAAWWRHQRWYRWCYSDWPHQWHLPPSQYVKPHSTAFNISVFRKYNTD